jgi:hypothetical protein
MNYLSKDHWNYRVMAKGYKNEVYLGIYEVYYKDDIPSSYSKDPVTIEGNNLFELDKVLSLMTECLGKSILWYGEKFPEEYRKRATDYFILHKEFEDYKLKNPFKYKLESIWFELYCLITNNKLIGWIKSKFKINQI